MRTMKKIAALAAATVLATGAFAGLTSPADAAPRNPGTSSTGGVTTYMWDTGWG